jgi:hypothetical protein
VLIAESVLAYFQDPAHWTQGAFARDARDQECDRIIDGAKHCLSGGWSLMVRRANLPELAVQPEYGRFYRFLQDQYHRNMVELNDYQGYEAVIEALTTFIQQEKGEAHAL